MADTPARIVISAADRTKAAFDSAQRNIKGLTAGVAGLAGAFGPVGAAVTAVTTILGTISLKGVINTADDLGKLSQRTGVTVENLSALRFAGELAGISVDELGGALKKLNLNIAAASRGEKEQAEAFKLIGVEVKNLDGTVRSADDVLGDIADKFSGYADGANKVALANALGGKSFESLIPLLNGGRQGIADARTELEKFGGVYTKDLAARAEKFNDNITKAGFAVEGLKVKLLGGVLDGLGAISDRFITAAKNGEGFFDTLKRISGIGTVSIAVPKFGVSGTELQQQQADLERLIALRDRINAPQTVGSVVAGAFGLGARAELKQVNEDIVAARNRIAGLQTSAAKTANGPKSPEAPALPDNDPDAKARAAKAAADALAAANKQTEARIKAIRDGLATERDLYQFNEQALRASYGQGILSLRAFYDEREALRVRDLAAQQEAVSAEIAELERQRAAAVRGKRPQDVADADTKIQEARARFAAAKRESDQARQVAVREQQQDVSQLADRYAELNAQIAALGGNTGPQELLDISRQVREAQVLLTQRGQDAGEADALQAALERQRQLAAVNKQSYEQSSAAANAEARLVIESKRNGAGLLETEQAIRAGREQALAQLDALIVSTKKLAEAGTAGAAQQLDDLQTQRAQLASQVDPTKLRFDAAAEEGAASIADAFREATVEGKILGDVVSDLDKRLANIVLNEAIFKPLEQGIGNLLKGGTGGGASGGGLFDKAFSFIGSFFHGGGVVGDLGGMQRSVPYGAFSGAQRYHSGGIAGLAADEVPAVLRRGEEVLTQNDPRHRDNASSVGRSVVINAPMNISFNGPADRRSAGQVAAQARLAIEAAARDL